MTSYYATGANNGMYSLNEIVRSVTKLAPDMFVTFNNALGTSLSTSYVDDKGVAKSNVKNIGFKGGITSITASGTVAPAGGGSCTLQVTSPPYTGRHTSYYLENPDGTKTPFFQPMMEVRVYAKGRYLATPKKGQPGQNAPRYYTVFWGFVTGINEATSGGNFSFTLTCKDMLHWWNYQNIAIAPTGLNAQWGGGAVQATGTNLRYLNPWELIFNLFYETGFDSLVYPSFLGEGNLPVSLPAWAATNSATDPGAFGMMTKEAMGFWKRRFQADNIVPPDSVVTQGDSSVQKAYTGLEMFGFQKKLDLSATFTIGASDSQTLAKDRAGNISVPPSKASPTTVNPAPTAAPAAQTTSKDSRNAKVDSKKFVESANQVYRLTQNMSPTAEVTADFGLMGKVVPYGNFAENLPAVETINSTKLEVANTATQNLHLEFFQDMNGTFVFKPPFFNMDTSSTKTYRLLPEDILSMNESTESDGVINGLQVTGMLLPQATTPSPSAVHYDFASIARYGMRFRAMKVPYGNNAEEMRAVAVAEMTITNAQATTASIEIPLRPEIRLGYPVYIDHLDCYYYVVSITHSFSYGSAATTSLTLNAKRPKMWDYLGEDNGGKPTPMRAYIYMARDVYYREKMKNASGVEPSAAEVKAAILADYSGNADKATKVLGNDFADVAKGSDATVAGKDVARASDFKKDMTTAEVRDKSAGFIASPDPGEYVATKSPAYYKQVVLPTSNAVSPANAIVGSEGRTTNELVTYTKDSVPYTDVSGYLHIGAYPYGANLSISDSYVFSDLTKLGSGGAFDLKDVFVIKPDAAAEPADGLATDETTIVPLDSEYAVSDASSHNAKILSIMPSQGKYVEVLRAQAEAVTLPEGLVNNMRNNAAAKKSAVAYQNTANAHAASAADAAYDAQLRKRYGRSENGTATMPTLQ